MITKLLKLGCRAALRRRSMIPLENDASNLSRPCLHAGYSEARNGAQYKEQH